MSDGQQLDLTLKAWRDNVIIPVLVRQYRTDFHKSHDSANLDFSVSNKSAIGE